MMDDFFHLTFSNSQQKIVEIKNINLEHAHKIV